jgi:hypothetical protein
LEKEDHFFGADEENGELRFCSRRHDEFDDLCNGEDGSIVRRDGVIF